MRTKKEIRKAIHRVVDEAVKTDIAILTIAVRREAKKEEVYAKVAEVKKEMMKVIPNVDFVDIIYTTPPANAKT